MNLTKEIEAITQKEVLRFSPLGGGCIAKSYLIEFASLEKMFLKTDVPYKNMFIVEANGLEELRKAKSIRIPKVFAATNNFLLLEYIEEGDRNDQFFSSFGKRFAEIDSNGPCGDGRPACPREQSRVVAAGLRGRAPAAKTDGGCWR